jgi:CRP-like cAMP-binding protein
MCFKVIPNSAASRIREAALFFKGKVFPFRRIYYFSLLFRYFNSRQIQFRMAHLFRDHIEAVSPLTDEEFSYILSHFIVKKAKKHSFLVQEGDHVRYEYFVMKGCLKAYLVDGNTGKEFIYYFAAEDWWITDREAFFKQEAATINVECLEDCELLGITLENREKLCAESRKYEHFLLVKSNKGYISLQKRLQMMIMGSAKDRYEHFIKNYPDLYDRIPKALIASYLGVSRETLSRLYTV